ncbi:MAG: YitT family protein [Bacteroidales bacterium]|nr:YitT family protein [Bacteroidales bacterium]
MKLPASHFLKDYSIITLGLLLYAIGFDCFLLPFEIATGGVAGAGAIIFYATGFWKVQYTYFLANAVLLVAAIKILGWKYCVKTVYATFVLTALLGGVEALMQHLYATTPGLFPAFNEAVHLPQLTDNAFMSTIFGAALCGIGIGYVFGRGGSTGGTDIIASIINKYKNMSLGTVMMLCDVLIVSSSLLLPDYNLQKVLYGFTALLVVNLTLDFIYNRGRQSVQFFIISRKYEEIATAINVYHRGVTVIDARGWYTKKPSKVLMVMAKKRESSNIFAIIQAIDPQAFVTQTLAAGVFGDGFDHMRNIKNTNDKVQNALTTAAEAEDELENAANTIVESE